MDIILAAVITGLFTFGATLVGVYHREILDIFSRSRRDPTGFWSGTGRDVAVPGTLHYETSLTYKLDGELTKRGRRVRVVGTSVSDRTSTLRATGYLRGDYVVLNYCNVAKDVEDYGCGLLHLLGTREDMEGFFIGKRMREDGVALIQVRLKKLR